MIAAPMSATPSPTVLEAARGTASRPLRVGFVGPRTWLETSCPPPGHAALASLRLPIAPAADLGPVTTALREFDPAVTVVYDPRCVDADAVRGWPGVTLGIVLGDSDALASGGAGASAGAFDRLISFRPGLTGTRVGDGRLWRAVPPPVADDLFGEVRPLHGTPRTITLGRSTEHREVLLLPAKHHHDVLQLVHGVVGDTLIATMREYDVGLYVPPDSTFGFGAQVGMHLAAGQLLMTSGLDPGHGLERGIDYLHFNSAVELVMLIDRLGRFPDMYQRVRLRGRMKAERYRASALFARVLGDLLDDVRVFGSAAV